MSSHAGIFVLPADSDSVLQAAQLLLAPPPPPGAQPSPGQTGQGRPPLLSAPSMTPLQDHTLGKHFILLQDVAGGMSDARCVVAAAGAVSLRNSNSLIAAAPHPPPRRRHYNIRHPLSAICPQCGTQFDAVK
jgi:hypothetical protein